MATKEKDASFVKKLTDLVVDHFSTKKEIFKEIKTKDGILLKYQFAEVKTKDGAIVTYDGDMPMVGMPVFIVPSDGSEPIAPADGTLEIEDGSEIEVKGGVIVSVEPAEVVIPTPQPTGAMGNISETEKAAIKSITQSTITETVFSKQEVDAKIKSITDDFEKMKSDFAEMKTANDALHSANESLTKEIGKVSSANEVLIKETEKLTSFSKQLPELLKEFGATPQVTETEEEKQKRLGTFASEQKPKLTDTEWKAKYMKH